MHSHMQLAKKGANSKELSQQRSSKPCCWRATARQNNCALYLTFMLAKLMGSLCVPSPGGNILPRNLLIGFWLEGGTVYKFHIL